MSNFVIGSTWRPKARFKAAGTLTDPTSITLIIRQPNGTETSYTYGAAQITKVSTGIYYKDITIDASGQWVARYKGTGAVPDAAEHVLDVPPSLLASP